MAKYHISLNGEPALCKARTKPCPRAEHYDSLEKAQHVAELAHEAFEEAIEYPRSTANFVKSQAKAFWDMDGQFASLSNVYVHAGYSEKSVKEERFKDYRSGFEAGLAAEARESESALAQYKHDNDPGNLYPPVLDGEIEPPLIDDTAYLMGFARAQRIRHADRDEFVTENIVDRGLRGGETRQKYGKARFLRQPFKRGDTIVVPAGTKFHSWDAEDNDVYDEFKEAREIKINDTFDPYIDGSSDWVQLHPAQVSYAGPHGYWRDIVLTPEIVAMNGKPVYEAAIGMESLLRPSLHEEIPRSN